MIEVSYYRTSRPDSEWYGYPKQIVMSTEQHTRCQELAEDGGWTVDAILPERAVLIYCDASGRYFHVRHDGSAQEVDFTPIAEVQS